MISGKHYNRAIRVHKVVYEALQRLQWRAFEKSASGNERQALVNLQGLNQRLRSLPGCQVCLYAKFVNHDRGPLAVFWRSYCYMVELLLQFVRSTRVGDWCLHLQCLQDMIPWMFCYDRVNYSRYLTVYWHDMVSLPKSHPDANALLEAGEFTVQRSQNSFAQVPVDLSIEQSINRDTKTKGGIVGCSLKPGAVHRWVLTAHDRAGITASCEAWPAYRRLVMLTIIPTGTRICLE